MARPAAQYVVVAAAILGLLITLLHLSPSIQAASVGIDLVKGAKLYTETTTALTEGETDARCKPSTFEALLSKGSVVLSTRAIPAGGSLHEDDSDDGKAITVTDLPALCAAKFRVPTSETSSMDYALFLPQRWNKRFMTVGNDGWSGYINWSHMGEYSHYGFAVLSTNTGHYSDSLELGWAVGDLERMKDWAYRAVHESVTLAKGIVKMYYKETPAYSYFAACSNGGRQALKEVTLHPDEFDGILVGAPAWIASPLISWLGEMVTVNFHLPAESQIPPAHFHTIAAEIQKQCSLHDISGNAILADCVFVPEAPLCSSSFKDDVEDCLTEKQIATLAQLLKPWLAGQGTAQPGQLILRRDHFMLATGLADLAIKFLKDDLPRLASVDPAANKAYLETFKLFQQLGASNIDIDLRELEAFHAKGGKVLHYHGTSDELVLDQSSKLLHTLMKRGYSDIGSWYRFFLVPGMHHCACIANEEACYFAAPGQASMLGVSHSTPGLVDAEHDVTLALMEWVEKDNVPEKIVATEWNGTLTEASRARAVCPYPEEAVYDGVGDKRLMASWTCR